MMRTITITAVALALALSLSIAHPHPEAGTTKPVPTEIARKLDPVELLITKGLTAYQSDNDAQALAHLQQAVALIQEKLFQGLAALFPDPPKGWTADDIRSNAMSMGSGQGSGSWTQLSRSYVRTKDKVRVTLSLTNSSQLLPTPPNSSQLLPTPPNSSQLLATQQAAAEAYKNPMMMQMMNQDPNIKAELIDRHGWTGWKIVEKNSRAQLIAFSRNCLLSLDASKADETALDTIFNAIDLKALADPQAKSPVENPE